MSYEVISDIRKNTICFSSANYFTGYKVDDQNSSLDERREITFRYLVCTYFASHPEFYPVSNEESFPEDEELEPEADCPHTSSADTEMSGTRTPLLNAYIRAFFFFYKPSGFMFKFISGNICTVPTDQYGFSVYSL